MNYFKKYLIIIGLLLLSPLVFSQENVEKEEVIDASKPTNFYSSLNNTLEFAKHKNHNVFGYRGNLTFSPSDPHLIMTEIPLLYNDQSLQIGLGDIRVRYFWLPYKNYNKFVGAFGPSVDVFAPTGSFSNGIGSGRWLISPGVTVGLMAAEWLQFFPIVSYQYASRPVYENPVSEMDIANHGITFQVMTPIVFSDKFFVQITPIYKMNNINDEKEDRFVQELFASYAITKKMQLTCFYDGDFKEEIHTVSLGLTVFL